jgi:hypothetical protein
MCNLGGKFDFHRFTGGMKCCCFVRMRLTSGISGLIYRAMGTL